MTLWILYRTDQKAIMQKVLEKIEENDVFVKEKAVILDEMTQEEEENLNKGEWTKFQSQLKNSVESPSTSGLS